MAKRRKFRGSSVKRGNLIEMYGVSDMLKSIEKAGGKVDVAVQKAVDASLKIVGDDMQSFMSGHKTRAILWRALSRSPRNRTGTRSREMPGTMSRKAVCPQYSLMLERRSKSRISIVITRLRTTARRSRKYNGRHLMRFWRG